MPQFRNLTKKHIAAICGSVMRKKTQVKSSNFGIDDHQKFLKDKRSPHSRLIRSLTITELSQPNLIFRAQERRSLQFWNISHQAWQDAFAKPLEEEKHDRVSSFLDRLWIRAVSLCDQTNNSTTELPARTQSSVASITASNTLEVIPSCQTLADANGDVTKAETASCHEETASVHTNIETSEMVPEDGTMVESTTDAYYANAVNETPKYDALESTTSEMDSFEDLVETSDADKTEPFAAAHGLNSSSEEDTTTAPKSMDSEPKATLEVPSSSKVSSIAVEVATEATTVPAFCIVCASLNNLYAVTLGPVNRSDLQLSKDTPADSKTKLSKPQVLLCQKCALRCRMSAVKVASSAKTRTTDALGEWFRRRNQDGEVSLGCETEPICPATQVPSPDSCDTCFLAELLSYFQRVLLPLQDQLTESSTPDDCPAVEPLGSLLFLACTTRPVKPEEKSNWDLFNRYY
ncbi:unnamed protein product [Dibothriocephalus latus]|uniref:Uncharacterized protein n=1 Tax=Dibothriocephalus latus TaxID=60516 RepID=A0A3P7LF61_DIBLA|nr:unnamed protein product [Dibothriocephalus latus]